MRDDIEFRMTTTMAVIVGAIILAILLQVMVKQRWVGVVAYICVCSAILIILIPMVKKWGYQEAVDWLREPLRSDCWVFMDEVGMTRVEVDPYDHPNRAALLISKRTSIENLDWLPPQITEGIAKVYLGSTISEIHSSAIRKALPDCETLYIHRGDFTIIGNELAESKIKEIHILSYANIRPSAFPPGVKIEYIE